MIPDYKIQFNGKEITPKINTVLIVLEINELNGEEADTLRLEIDDSTGKVALPEHGAEISAFIGWKGADLADKGTFTVDEVEHQGAPDRVIVHARSASMVDGLPGKKSRSWETVTLQEVVNDIAADHGLKAVVSPSLAGNRLAAPQQTAESDLHFLTRLGKTRDAVVTIKNGHLLFLKKGEAKTASGKAMPTITVERTESINHHYRNTKRGAYTGVKARWHSKENNLYTWELAGTEERVTELAETFTTQEEALEAAKGEWERLQRGLANLTISLATGNEKLSAEARLEPLGFKKQIDSTKWTLARVTHVINSSGFASHLEAEAGK